MFVSYPLPLILICFLLCSCHTSKNQDIRKQEPVQQPTGKFIRVTVTDYRNLDGCEYLLVKEDGEKWQPVNLADSLKQDKLKLLVTVEAVEQFGICMAGSMVRITGVRWNK